MSLSFTISSVARYAAIVTSSLLALPGFAATKKSKDETTGKAMEILRVNCLSCHNKEKEKGGLVLETREAALKGGDTGPSLKSGKPDDSSLIKVLAADADPHMPPKKQLTDAQISALKTWVKAGAKWDATALVEPVPVIKPVALGAVASSYQAVLALSLSPDAKKLAVGRANRVLVYDVGQTNFPIVKELDGHRDPVQAIAWSPDTKWIASGSFRKIVLWNAETLAIAREVTEGLYDRISALEFTTNSATLVIADGMPALSGMVRLIDVATGKQSASWQAHNDAIFGISLSRDGKLLATAAADKLVKVWELESRKELSRLEGHTSQVLGIAFNGEGTQLVSGGGDKEIKVWDVKTKEKVATLGDNHKSGINALAWTPDSKNVFAATDDGRILNYTELKTHSGAERSAGGKERGIGNAEEVIYCLSSSADGKLVYAGGHSGNVYVWNDGKLVTKLAPKSLEKNANARAAK